MSPWSCILTGDPMCLALWPRTEEGDEMLEMVMPLQEIPGGSDVEEVTPLTENQ